MDRRDFLQSLAGTSAALAAAGLLRPDALFGSDADREPDVDPALDGEDFWFAVQRAFPVDRSVLNLDNGNVSPSPRRVTEAVVRHTWQQQEAPGRILWDVLAPLWDGVHENLARLAGCDPHELAIVRNATEALNNVLLGLELEPGDEVLLTSHDYWHVQDTIAQRSAREGIRVRTIAGVPASAESMDELIAMYERDLSPRTKLLVVTHPWNANGQLMPVREICDMAHRHGVEVLVDGAQSFALVDHRIADLGCDYYAASLHKWFCGPIGTGILYIRKGKAEKVWPLFPPSANASPRNPMARFTHLGTRSAALGAGIAEAITFHESIGAERKEARLRRLTAYWSDRIRALPSARFHTPADPAMSCGIAAFNLEGIDARELAEHLWREHQILVSALTFDQSAAGRPTALHAVRVTPHVYTTLPELDRFVEIVEGIAARGRIG